MKKLVTLSAVAAALVVASSNSFAAATATPNAAQLSQEIAQLQAQTQQLQRQVRVLRNRQARSNNNSRVNTAKNNKKLRFHGISVTTSPYIGLRSRPDASDQLVNAPSINEDLYLLLQRDQLAIDHGYSYPNAPLLTFSGDILGGLNFGSKSNVTVNAVDVYLEAIASKWALGLVSLSYSNGLNDFTNTDAYHVRNNNLVNNSRIYMSRAFLTIGNLSKFPVYGSFGQMYVPFGVYSSYLISTPVTKSFGRTAAPTAQVGFFKDGFNASAYLFQGFNKMRGSDNTLDRWGMGGSYALDTKVGKQKLGVGYISTVTDSIGLNNAQIFKADTQTGTRIQRSVPAVDIYSKINFNNFGFVGEYIFTTNSFDADDLTDSSANGSRKPSVMDLEAGYKFPMRDWSSNFYLDYQHSTKAAYLGFARDSFAGVLNTSPFKNAVLSAELRHDSPYTVANQAGNSNAMTKTSTIAYLQAALYF